MEELRYLDGTFLEEKINKFEVKQETVSRSKTETKRETK